MMHCEYNVNGSSYCLAIWVWCVLLIFGWLYACCQEVLMLDWIVNFGAGFAEGGECQGDKQGSTFGESFAGEGTAQLPPPLLCRCTLHSGQAFFLNVDMSIYIYEEDRLAVARARKIELVHLESFLGVIRLMVFGMILILSGSISLLVSLLFLRRFSKFHHICFVFLWNFYFF